MIRNSVNKITSSERMEIVKNTIIWGCFNTVFGVCPLLLLLALSRLPLRPDVCVFAQTAYEKLVNDGSLIFFFLAMVGSSITDVYIGRRKFTGDFAWNMFAGGCMAITAAIFFYMAFLLGGDERHPFGQAKGILQLGGGFTLLFCGTAKYQLLLKEMNKQKEEQS